MQELATLLKQKFSANSPEVQNVIQKHYNWVKRSWTPDRNSFAGLGELYTHLDWKPFFTKYDPEHPKLAMFLAEAMEIFAKKNL